MLQKVLDALAHEQFELALVEANDAVTRFPEMAEAHHLLAIARGAVGDFEPAMASIEKAIALAPDNSVFHTTKGSLLARCSDEAAAEAALHEAVTLNPNAFSAYVSLAHLAIARGDFEQAQQHTARAALIEPDAADVLILRGVDAQSRGDLETAASLFAAALAAEPGSTLAQARLGSCLLAQGHHAFAEQALGNALRVQPTNRSLRWDLLRAITAQGRGEDALAQLDILVEQQPGDANALSLRADMLMSAGRLDEAAAGYAALLRELPDHPHALTRLIQAWRALGRYDEAVVLLEERIQAHPGRNDFWTLRLAIEGLDLDNAEQISERWYQASPDSPLALQAMAQVRELRSQLDQAESFADRALVIEPSLGAAQLVKLRAELRQQPERALARTRRLLDGEPQGEARRSVLHWHGLALDRAGRAAQALSAWQETWQLATSALPLPGSRPIGEAPVPEQETAPAILLWTLPGAPAEALIAPLALTTGHVVLTDRFASAPRADGFDPFRQRTPEGLVAGTYAAWHAGVQALGFDPERAIDWIPHWDRAAQAQFPNGRVIVLVRDPRDLLLNWLAFGCPHQYGAADLDNAALWLRHVLEPLLAFRDEQPQRVLLLRGEEVEHDRVGTLARLTGFAGIGFRDEARIAQSLPHASGRVRSGFAAGHWRDYAQALAAPFATLQPLAQALGYGDAATS